jgi:hypothetical protein
VITCPWRTFRTRKSRPFETRSQVAAIVKAWRRNTVQLDRGTSALALFCKRLMYVNYPLANTPPSPSPLPSRSRSRNPGPGPGPGPGHRPGALGE